MQANLYLHEMYGFPRTFSFTDAQLLALGRVVANVAAADGMFSAPEREQMLATVAVCGASDAVLAQLRQHDPQPDDVTRHLADAAPIPPRVLLYEAIRVAYANRVYDPRERHAVRVMAAALAIDEPTVELIEHLFDSERTLRAMRVALLAPEAEDLEAPGAAP